LLSSRGTKGAAPCHLVTDKTDKHLFVANYTEGTFTAFDISWDGSLGEVVNVTAHEGKGMDEIRQEKAHVHYVAFSPENLRYFHRLCMFQILPALNFTKCRTIILDICDYPRQ
jgi:6-phosphogluconolactonase (cycloisomerase 2 family)